MRKSELRVDTPPGTLVPYIMQGELEPYRFNDITQWATGNPPSVFGTQDSFSINKDKGIPDGYDSSGSHSSLSKTC
jgi:hypothetical protein